MRPETISKPRAERTPPALIKYEAESGGLMNVEQRRRISHLYQQAISRPDEERHAFLISACAGDEGLREEVELLLVGHKIGRAHV